MAVVNVIVVGGGGHCKVILDTLEQIPGYLVVGILDYNLDAGCDVMGYTVLGREEDLLQLVVKLSIDAVVIAVGDNYVRSQIYQRIKSICGDIFFPTVIHPSALVARGVTFGEGTVVLPGVIINSLAKIGNFCILNTSCAIDHETELGDFSSFGPKACCGGGVKVGAFSAVCIGATVCHQCAIGDHTVIGAGATVLGDVSSYIVAYGTPARFVRHRNEGDSYLHKIKDSVVARPFSNSNAAENGADV